MLFLSIYNNCTMYILKSVKTICCVLNVVEYILVLFSMSCKIPKDKQYCTVK